MPKKNYTLDKFYYNGITFLNDEQFKKFSMDELNYYSKIFSDILGQVPTDPNGKSFHESYCLCKKKKDGFFSWSSFNDQKRIISTAINAMKNMDRDNFYVGANSYMGKIRERSEKSVFALKNIVIDLDCHDKHSFEDGSYFYQCINKANNFLKELSSQSGIPLPNLVNFTGRGVQIWYFLDPCSKKLSFVYQAIANHLCGLFKPLAKKSGFIIDQSASNNINRIFRIPGTYNPEAGVFSQCVRLSKGKYSLPALQKQLCITFDRKEHNSQIPLNISDRKKRMKSNVKTRVFDGLPASVLHRRCKIIEHIVKSGRDVFSRENLLFLYHNFALLLPDVNAETAVHELNQYFPVPLKEREINSLIRCTTKKEGYYYQDETFFEKASMTKEEINLYYSYKKQNATSKNHARNARRKENKQNKIKQIQFLYRHGRTKKFKEYPMLSVKEIAKKTGSSVNTVYKYTDSIKKGIERKDFYLSICEKLKELRKKKNNILNEYKKSGILSDQKNIQKYIKVRTEYEAVCYAENICLMKKNSTCPGRNDIENLYNAVLDILNGKRAIVSLIRCGIKIDKQYKTQFVTRSKSIYQMLISLFPKLEFYFVKEESYLQQQKTEQQKRKLFLERQQKRQEEMVEIFSQSIKNFKISIN